MSDCYFGHAKTLIVSQHEQGACCDRKAYHHLKKDGVYEDDTPLTIVDGAVPRQYEKLTSSDQPFCGLLTCGVDTTDWQEESCVQSICVEAKSLIAKTVTWPEGFTDDDVEIIRAQKDCCFELIGAPCCHEPALPACDPAEGK